MNYKKFFECAVSFMLALAASPAYAISSGTVDTVCGSILIIFIIIILVGFIVSASNKSFMRNQDSKPEIKIMAEEFLAQDISYYEENRYRNSLVTGKIASIIWPQSSVRSSVPTIVFEGDYRHPDRFLKCHCYKEYPTIQPGETVTVRGELNVHYTSNPEDLGKDLLECEVVSRAGKVKTG